MPLSQRARQYANDLYYKAEEEITGGSQNELAALANLMAAKSKLASGNHVRQILEHFEQRTKRTAQAKMDSLLAAYEKDGIPLNDPTLDEIGTEVTQYCENQQAKVIDYVIKRIKQLFPNGGPDGLIASSAQTFSTFVTNLIVNLKRDLRIKGHVIALDEKRSRELYAAGMEKQWDVFISHASEDKQQFVGPLERALGESGLLVWYDKTALTVATA